MKIRPKFQRLKIDQMCEIASANSIGKTGIILDAGSRARLSPLAQTIQYQSGQAFGGRINSGAEAGRARAQNENVINRIWQLAAKTKVIRQLGPGGRFKKD